MLRQDRKGEEAATAVEFSLIAILLFTLLLGIVQFGLTYNRQQGLHAAVREGARLASLGNDVDKDDVRLRVAEAAPAFIIDPQPTGGDLVIGIERISDGVVAPDGEDDFCKDADNDGVLDEQVTVTVAIDPAQQDKYDFGLPLLAGLVSPDLSSSATFQCEQARP